MTNQRNLWWLHPLGVFAVPCGLVGLFALLIPGATYNTLWSMPKFFNTDTFWLVTASIVLFVAGFWLNGVRFAGFVDRAKEDPEPELSDPILLRLFRVAWGLCMLGYVVWSGVAISRGLTWSVLLGVLQGEPGLAYAVRSQYLGNIVGITTCTQFGIAAVILGALYAARNGWRKVWKSLAMMFVLALLRAILNTERLALIELVVPLLVVVISQQVLPGAKVNGWWRRLLQGAPIAGIAGLYLAFAIFEYFRSWITYYAGGAMSFWEFAGYRLAGYYVTALNNGAYLVNRLNTPLGVPFFTLNFLWRFPLVNNLVAALYPDFHVGNNYFDILDSGSNAEFNNADGLLAPVMDVGTLGIVYWLISGIICAAVYRRFRQRSAWGLCMYPFLYLGLLDVIRGLYWSGGRAFPAACFLLFSAFLLRQCQKREQTAKAAQWPAAAAAKIADPLAI